jgi:bifunctional non-homologous end joining protein LigD
MALARPDYVVFDLDPGDRTKWSDVIEAARVLHALLDELALASCVKTSGKRGLHVLVPIAATHTHDEAALFARRVADAVARARPAIATTERLMSQRKGRLYVDAIQNGRGRLLVMPYSVRALDGAPVSAPLRWSEVVPRLDPSRFTIRTMLRRIASMGDVFADALHGRATLPHVR